MTMIKGNQQGSGGNAMDNVDLSHAKTLECEKCKCIGFQQTMILKKLSALISPNGQESIIPVSAFGCQSCGHVNKEFRDAEIKQSQ